MRSPNILDVLILVFGTINLLRIGVLLIGADMYSLVRHLNRKNRNKHLYRPMISVVIPAFNEHKTVLRSVQSVLANTYPTKLTEVIVVDDGSTDKTPEKLKEFKRNHPEANLKIVRQENSGKAHALNNGILHHSKGELIMCLDADSAIAPESLQNAVEYFVDGEVQGLSANVKILPDNTLLNLIQRIEYLVCYQMKRAHNAFNMEYIIGGIGSVFRRAALEKVGMYDTDTVTEDIDLTMKVISRGNKANKVLYGADVIAYTESVLSVPGLIRQRYRWKWGRFQTFYKNYRMFFSLDKKYTKSLTWVQLPMALYGDIAFIFEPVLVVYIFYISFAWQDWFTLASAWITVSSYVVLNIVAEESLRGREKWLLGLAAPLLYLAFYVLSFAEYMALIKSVVKLHTVPKSLMGQSKSWVPVERSGKIQAV